MSQNQAIELRAKIIGVLLRDARLAARKTKKEVGEAIGVSTATISSYELGRKSPSLPEIEIFCLFLSIPINHFWSAETMSEQPGPANNLHVEQLLDLRKGIIAAMVAKARNYDKPLERELAMVKVAGTGDKRVEALRLADAFRAQVIDATPTHFVFEITGRTSKIEQFIAIMGPMGLVEVCRTGVAALNRGEEAM